MKNKKGSHVGLVLSFVLFVTFLVFIFQVLAPVTLRGEKNSDLIDFIQANAIQESMGTVYTVRINSTGCVQFPTPNSTLTNVVSLNSSGDEVESRIDAANTIVNTAGFITIRYHKNFTKTQTYGGATCPPDVTPGNVLVEDRILENRILYLVDLVASNYTLLQEKLDAPSNKDFDIQFMYSNGTLVKSTSERKIKSEIYSREIAIDYLSKGATEEIGKLIVKVW